MRFTAPSLRAGLLQAPLRFGFGSGFARAETPPFSRTLRIPHVKVSLYLQYLSFRWNLDTNLSTLFSNTMPRFLQNDKRSLKLLPGVYDMTISYITKRLPTFGSQ